VRIVAVRADHRSGARLLIGSDWVSGQFHTVGTLPTMTFETHCGLRRAQLHRVCCCVHAMATNAPGIISLVHATCPRQTDSIIVAIHTNGVLVRHRRCCVCAEVYDCAVHFGWTATSRMGAARSVAILTLQLRHRRLGVSLLAMRRTKNNQHVFSVVAPQAGIGTTGTVVSVRGPGVLATGGNREQQYQGKNRPKSAHRFTLWKSTGVRHDSHSKAVCRRRCPCPQTSSGQQSAARDNRNTLPAALEAHRVDCPLYVRCDS